jgi:hypothetical protein
MSDEEKVEKQRTEGKFLKRASGRLRPQEPDQHRLDNDPAAVHEKEFPPNGASACKTMLVIAPGDKSAAPHGANRPPTSRPCNFNNTTTTITATRKLTNWVNIGAKKLGNLPKKLKDGNSTSALGEGEDLNEVGCGLSARQNAPTSNNCRLTVCQCVKA